MRLSRTQIDRLGERLRHGDVRGDDLRTLDAYRRSFAEPYADVVAVLRNALGLAPTGRPAKSTKSIVDKLNRETARLSQVQDIAGCRVITADIAEQDRIVEAIRERVSDVTGVDRRARPSNGYRVVHVLVAVGDHRMEVQVRTALQQLWAELSEKLSDRFGIAVKYGGGDAATRDTLDECSELVGAVEHTEAVLRANVADAEISRVVRRGHSETARTSLLRAIAQFTVAND